MFDLFNVTPPRVDSDPISALKERRRQEAAKSEAFNEMFESLFGMLEEAATDENHKVEVGIMRKHIALNKLCKEFTKYAGDKDGTTDLETKKAALDCMDKAVSILTEFLSTHDKPTKTIFD